MHDDDRDGRSYHENNDHNNRRTATSNAARISHFSTNCVSSPFLIA